MSNQVTERDGVVIISLSGKIMGGPEAGQINDQINNYLDKQKFNIIIDLAEVEWMNSSGLGILIGSMTTIKNNNGRMVLVNVSERISKLLSITKLSGVFQVKENIEEAVKSF